MKKTNFLTIFIILLLCVSLSSSAVDGKKKNTKKYYITLKNKRNLRYNVKSSRQKLDVYYPKKVKKNRNNPVVLFIHGGSYASGSKYNYAKINKKYFTNAGYVYVPVNYRLSKNAKFPGAANDIKTAIRYLKHNRKRLYINPNKIIIVGYSAGANLGSLVTSTPSIKSFNNEPVRYKKYSSKVAGFIGISGFYNLDSFYDLKDEILPDENNNENEEPDGEEGEDSTSTTEENGIVITNRPLPIKPLDNQTKYSKVQLRMLKYFNGGNYTPTKAELKKANTFNYIRNIKVPIMIEHSYSDKTIPISQAKEFCTTLRKNKKKASCYYFSKFSHGYSNFAYKANYKRMIYWMNKTVKHKK